MLIACLLAAGPQADAGPVNSNLTFNGPQERFGVIANASGTAQISGNGHAEVWTVFFHTGADFNVPLQTRTLSLVGAPLNVNTNPTGTATLTHDDQDATPLALPAMFVDLQNGTTQPIAVPELSFNISATVLSIFTFNMQLKLNIAGALKQLRFQSNAPGTIDPASYSIPGDFIGGLQGSVTGRLEGVPIVGTQDLGTLFSIDDGSLLNQPFGLFGESKVQDLQPHSTFYPHDLGVKWVLNLPLSFDIPVPVVGVLNQTFPNPPSGQSGVTRVNLNYNIQLVINLSMINYNLETVKLDAITSAPAGAPSYRFWDGNQDFSTFSGTGLAQNLGPDANWAYGTRVATAVVPFDGLDGNWLIGNGNTGWIYTANGDNSTPGIAKADTTPPAGINAAAGDVVMHSGTSIAPATIKWTAPANVFEAFASAVVWDATPNNRPQTIALRHYDSLGVLIQTIGGSTTTIDPRNSQSLPASLFAGFLVPLPGDRFELSVAPTGSSDFVGAHFYVEDSVALPTPTPSPSPSETPTVSPTVSPSPTPSLTPSISPSRTPTPSRTATPSLTPTVSPTASVSPSPTASQTASVSPTASLTASLTPTESLTPTATPTPTPTLSPSLTLTPTPNAAVDWSVYE